MLDLAVAVWILGKTPTLPAQVLATASSTLQL